MLPHPSTLGLSTPQFKWMSSLSTPVIVWFVSSLEPLDRSKLDDIRGTPMDVGSLEEFIDESSSQTTTWTELWYDCMNPMTWDFRSCLFLSEMLQTLRNHCIVSTAMGPECTTQSHFCNCQDCQAYSFQLSRYYVNILSFVDKETALCLLGWAYFSSPFMLFAVHSRRISWSLAPLSLCTTKTWAAWASSQNKFMTG